MQKGYLVFERCKYEGINKIYPVVHLRIEEAEMVKLEKDKLLRNEWINHLNKHNEYAKKLGLHEDPIPKTDEEIDEQRHDSTSILEVEIE